MSTWPDNRIQTLFGIDLPILLAPMAGAGTVELAVAVSRAGGLASLPCAQLTADQIRKEVSLFRQQTPHPLNLNFFCHHPPQPSADRQAAWRKHLDRYYTELGIDSTISLPASSRAPFDSALCDLVTELRPEMLSFHFGLPDKELLARAKSTGAKILSSATTVDEARWLQDRGCDAIIAQGAEAGGHRGMFLSDDISTQVGTFALIPQIVDAVKVPIIAAGGIADARGMVAAFALGASAVQIGTAYLFCPEAKISSLYRRALRTAGDNQTALTNVFTGRPARGILNRLMREIGPMSQIVPEFPLASGALAPLRAKSESTGSADFTNLWSGQSAALGKELPAEELTKRLAADALLKLHSLAG